MNLEKALVWFRRDLRDYDHAALSAALAEAACVHCAFVFDSEILDALPTREDMRVHFIRESLVELDAALRARGGGLIVRHGPAREELPRLAAALGVQAVFANRDYEPAAKARDAAVAEQLARQGIAFTACKDQVIFESREVLTQAGQTFSVFTPYKNAWLKQLTAKSLATYSCAMNRLSPEQLTGIPTLEEIGFLPSRLPVLGITPGMRGAQERWQAFQQNALGRYGELRDYPAVRGVSYLSVHLRFGTISIRQLVSAALSRGADAWLNELIWRDFYFMILDQHPQVADAAFKPAYDRIVWDNSSSAYAAWCQGQTGYPLVDAAMRQLNHCGWMHNRLRMIVASFLTKDLGVDWRLGEKYFADKLIDFDLAANNGGWQWAASSGCDAQPYFRIFNPVTQSEKFDADGKFIKRYVPELKNVPTKYIHAPWAMKAEQRADCGLRLGEDYPWPIVDHAAARELTLARYAVVKG